MSEVLSTLHRMASFAESSFSALTDAVGNGMLRDALQEVGDPAIGVAMKPWSKKAKHGHVKPIVEDAVY